jgi:hypothetical protein
MKIFALGLGALALMAPLNAAFAGFVEVPVSVPEPATLTLMAIGVGGAVIASRFRKKR